MRLVLFCFDAARARERVSGWIRSCEWGPGSAAQEGGHGQATHSDRRDSSVRGCRCHRGGKDGRQLGTEGGAGEVLGCRARREKPEIVNPGGGGDRRLGNSFQQRWARDPMEVPGYEFPRNGVPPGEH